MPTINVLKAIKDAIGTTPNDAVVEIESLRRYTDCDADTVNIYSGDDSVEEIEEDNAIGSGELINGQWVVNSCCKYQCYKMSESVTIEVISVLCDDGKHWASTEQLRFWILDKISKIDGLGLKYEGGSKTIETGYEYPLAVRVMNFTYEYELNLEQ